ncbi:hypothetical protein LPB86_03170 [Pedobacter sp. MC2016-14]|uniref:hypothetical protein n=1 Tax=Pedobacter sp. MC2016-14 TaxID=2897327 RepID=UPI001E5A719B|nr:hypothetical protein [Pedobacter sp. MC2016-14]MCD0487212.1 hypothetical protein [Pedobacter sp. MC2016-14]
MKVYILTLLLIAGITGFAKAQSNKIPTAQELATKSIDEMDKTVKMNPTQRNIIYNYTLDMTKEQLALIKKQQAGNYNEDDVSKFYKLQNQTTQNIKTILKGDQIAAYDKFLEDQLSGNSKKKKKKGKRGKEEEEEVVTGISGLKLPPPTP